MYTTEYLIEDEYVYLLEKWKEESFIKTLHGMRVRSIPNGEEESIERFEVDQYVLKEHIPYIQGDDEERTQFNELLSARIAFWKSEGSV
jgi:hypothetical protein